MPNDIPDWTRSILAQLVGRAPNFIPLGDVTSPSLAKDQVIETFFGSNLNDHAGVIASFKAAVGQVIAPVGSLGAFTVGATGTVTPPFGQATTSGHLLVAWVTANSSAINSASPGWVEIFNAGTNDNASIWAKPNCGAGETAPTFTCSGATLPMMAQVAEFSGAATSSPNENFGGYNSPPIADPMTITASAADAATGDLLLCATVWNTGANSATATFSDAYNNQATPVAAGNSGAVSRKAHSNFSYAIIPALVGAQPQGVAAWAYDATGTSAPASGSAASVVLAATPGKTYFAADIDASIISTAAAVQAPLVQLKDGTSILWQQYLGVSASAAENMNHLEKSMAGYRGTAGNSMTLAFSAGATSIAQAANLGAYLR